MAKTGTRRSKPVASKFVQKAKRRRKVAIASEQSESPEDTPRKDSSSELEHIEGNDSAEYISEGSEGPTSAYQALLESLQGKGGTFTRAFEQRKREEQGISSDEDDASYEDVAGIENNNNDGNKEIDLVPGIVGLADGELYDHRKVDAVDDLGETFPIGVDESHEDGEEDPVTTHSTYVSAFKKHVEHILTDNEAALLSKGETKFRCQAFAAGLHKSKWVTTSSEFPVEEKNLKNCGIKLRLRNSWLSCHEDLRCGDFTTQQQCQFFNYCNSYQDILHSRRPTFYVDGNAQDFEIMDSYLLHSLNHIMNTRDLVKKNNEKSVASSIADETPRDQGFTRPKVLILLPLRSCALRLVKRLLTLLPPLQRSTVEHKARFFEEFGVEDEDSEDIESATARKTSKPADFNALFRGNNDDHFRMGIKLTRRSVKLFSDFYASDLIIASPLGLLTRIGEAEQEKDKNVDFLSSIEILVIDYADFILMQNWSHVVDIGEQLNQIPGQQHGTDFMRIREWFLNGHARYYRQSIILSSFADAGINAFFHRSCCNHAGKIKMRSDHSGVLSKVLLQVRQVYERFNCNSLVEVDDNRFNLFVKQVFPPLKESLQGGIMIFVSSYFDFVRLRNFLKSENMSFCLLGEYTKQSDISRSRAWFFHGKRRILLYSERAHFYHRYKIRGIKDLIFYSLPENAEFYAEITNMMEGLENPSSLVLFSQFDNLKLERIVGTSRANKMLKAESRTFMFC